MMNRLILASASPRRKELIKKISDLFECIPADIEETIPNDLDNEKVPEHLAKLKAEHIYSLYHDSLVIGCDTVVVAKGKILGKPKDKMDAYDMLSMLSGITHEVITGVCVINSGVEKCFAEKSFVTFKKLSENQINDYIKTGEPMDKAGAYGIQTKGSELVEKYDGDYYNIVGLPIERIKKELENDNIIFG